MLTLEQQRTLAAFRSRVSFAKQRRGSLGQELEHGVRGRDSWGQQHDGHCDLANDHDVVIRKTGVFLRKSGSEAELPYQGPPLGRVPGTEDSASAAGASTAYQSLVFGHTPVISRRADVDEALDFPTAFLNESFPSIGANAAGTLRSTASSSGSSSKRSRSKTIAVQCGGSLHDVDNEVGLLENDDGNSRDKGTQTLLSAEDPFGGRGEEEDRVDVEDQTYRGDSSQTYLSAFRPPSRRGRANTFTHFGAPVPQNGWQQGISKNGSRRLAMGTVGRDGMLEAVANDFFFDLERRGTAAPHPPLARPHQRSRLERHQHGGSAGRLPGASSSNPNSFVNFCGAAKRCPVSCSRSQQGFVPAAATASEQLNNNSLKPSFGTRSTAAPGRSAYSYQSLLKHTLRPATPPPTRTSIGAARNRPSSSFGRQEVQVNRNQILLRTKAKVGSLYTPNSSTSSAGGIARTRARTPVRSSLSRTNARAQSAGIGRRSEVPSRNYPVSEADEADVDLLRANDREQWAQMSDLMTRYWSSQQFSAI